MAVPGTRKRDQDRSGGHQPATEHPQDGWWAGYCRFAWKCWTVWIGAVVAAFLLAVPDVLSWFGIQVEAWLPPITVAHSGVTTALILVTPATAYQVHRDAEAELIDLRAMIALCMKNPSAFVG